MTQPDGSIRLYRVHLGAQSVFLLLFNILLQSTQNKLPCLVRTIRMRILAHPAGLIVADVVVFAGDKKGATREGGHGMRVSLYRCRPE